MKFKDLSWSEVEEFLKSDDRCILPIGSTEQHAYLSLSTDSILAEKISEDAAESLGIPVLPVLNYGNTPSFMSYPGTITIKLETLNQILNDILDSLYHHGFRRIMVVNGHGGNMPAEESIKKWQSIHKGSKIKFHNWWRAAKTWEKVLEIDSIASHASWIENFEWTRLKDIELPENQKELINPELLKDMTPEEIRKLLGDGNYGGYYKRSDKEMNEIWATAVEETKELLIKDWD